MIFNTKNVQHQMGGGGAGELEKYKKVWRIIIWMALYFGQPFIAHPKRIFSLQ